VVVVVVVMMMMMMMMMMIVHTVIHLLICATSWKVAGSIPGGFIGNFSLI
jgi:hypothetical protein